MALATLGLMGKHQPLPLCRHYFLGCVFSMKAHAAAEVSDEAFSKCAERWPHDTPDTKEAYYIRDIFDSKS